MNRSEILESARRCVAGDREEDYGNPENNFARIASGHAKSDNWVDLAGYAACGGEIEMEDSNAQD